MNKYFEQALQPLANFSVESLEVAQVVKTRVKSRLKAFKLRISLEKCDLGAAIRGLKSELHSEFHSLIKQEELETALTQKHLLEQKLGEVKESIASLQTKKLVIQEERTKNKLEETAQVQAAAQLARRMKQEQELREMKRQEQVRILKEQEKKEEMRALQEKERKEKEAKEEKVKLLEELKEHANRRKARLEEIKKLPKAEKSVSEPRSSTLPRISPGPVKKYPHNRLFHLIQSEERQKEADLQEKFRLKIRRLEMRKHYAELVHQMFAPPIDVLKRKEMEVIKQREICKSVRVELRRRSHPVLPKASQSTSVSVTPVKQQRKTSSSGPKVRDQPDFLKKVKQDLDERILKLPRIRGALTPNRAERQAKTRAELLKRLPPTSAAALQLQDEADSLLLSSVKAKLAKLTS